MYFNTSFNENKGILTYERMLIEMILFFYPS